MGRYHLPSLTCFSTVSSWGFTLSQHACVPRCGRTPTLQGIGCDCRTVKNQKTNEIMGSGEVFCVIFPLEDCSGGDMLGEFLYSLTIVVAGREVCMCSLLFCAYVAS